MYVWEYSDELYFLKRILNFKRHWNMYEWNVLDFLQNNKGLGEVGGGRGKTKLLINIIIGAGGMYMSVHYIFP